MVVKVADPNVKGQSRQLLLVEEGCGLDAGIVYASYMLAIDKAYCSKDKIKKIWANVPKGRGADLGELLVYLGTGFCHYMGTDLYNKYFLQVHQAFVSQASKPAEQLDQRGNGTATPAHQSPLSLQTWQLMTTPCNEADACPH